MALLLMDGFDGIPTGYSVGSYLAQNFSTVVGDNYGTTTGFTDGKALTISPITKYTTSNLSKTIISGTNFVFGLRFKSNIADPHYLSSLSVNLGLLSIKFTHLSVKRLGIYYNGSVQATTAVLADYTTWKHVEVKVVNGVSVALYVNNIQEAIWNNPTIASATSFGITTYSEFYSNNVVWHIDDLYLMNTTGSFANDLLGSSAKIKIKPVTSAGSANEFTNFSGTSLVASIASVDGNHANSAVTDQKLLARIDTISDNVQVLGARTLSYTQNSDSPTKNAQDIISIDGNLTTKGSVYTPAVGTYGLNMREQFMEPADGSSYSLYTFDSGDEGFTYQGTVGRVTTGGESNTACISGTLSGTIHNYLRFPTQPSGPITVRFRYKPNASGQLRVGFLDGSFTSLYGFHGSGYVGDGPDWTNNVWQTGEVTISSYTGVVAIQTPNVNGAVILIDNIEVIKAATIFTQFTKARLATLQFGVQVK